MEKKIRDRRSIYLGAENSPLPIYDPFDGQTGILASAQNAMSFITMHEDRTRSGEDTPKDKGDLITAQEYVYSEMMRLLPSRSMLPLFLQSFSFP